MMATMHHSIPVWTSDPQPNGTSQHQNKDLPFWNRTHNTNQTTTSPIPDSMHAQLPQPREIPLSSDYYHRYTSTTPNSRTSTTTANILSSTSHCSVVSNSNPATERTCHNQEQIDDPQDIQQNETDDVSVFNFDTHLFQNNATRADYEQQQAPVLSFHHHYKQTHDMLPAFVVDEALALSSEFDCNLDVEIDFTPFLQLLDHQQDTNIDFSAVVPAEQALSQTALMLIAKYFHENLAIIKENGTRVICHLDAFDPQRNIDKVQRFLKEMDKSLGDREDLKMAINSLIPPTLSHGLASGLSSPMFGFPSPKRLNRRGIKPTKPPKLGPDGKIRKRGRPRKNPLPVISTPKQQPDNIFSENAAHASNDANEKPIKRKRVKTAIALESLHIDEVVEAAEAEARQRKKAFDEDEWKPETGDRGPYNSQQRKAHSSSMVIVPEGKVPHALLNHEGSSVTSSVTNSGRKSLTKTKTNQEKAQEEAELLANGPEYLDQYLNELQYQLRSVKHKHRKGTICPRCATEQKFKFALKARAKLHNNAE